MRKNLVALLLAVAMLCAMAVPAMAEKAEGWNNVNAEGYEYPDYSGQTLSFMWWGSDTRAQITEEIIHMWEEKTGATVEFENYDGGGYWTVFQSKMAANDLTDVFQMGNNWLTYYDTIEPLNAYIEDGTIDTTAISDAMIATTVNQANGDVTGISNGTNARCFAYNPAIFDEAGVAYPTDNWTWDDFAAAGRAITEKTGNPAITTLEYNSLAFSTVTQWKEGYNFYAMDGSDFAFEGDIEPLTYIIDLLSTLQAEGVIADFGIQNEIGKNIEADWDRQKHRGRLDRLRRFRHGNAVLQPVPGAEQRGRRERHRAGPGHHPARARRRPERHGRALQPAAEHLLRL